MPTFPEAVYLDQGGSARPGEHAAWFLNPAYRVVLVNALEPEERFRAYFNPTELEGSLSVTAGRLQPIGWSHPVKQYAYTGEIKIPFRFWLSTLAMRAWPPGTANRSEPAIGRTFLWDVMDVVKWLLSFCYAEDAGMAPAPLLVFWPKTLGMLFTVDEVSWKILHWDTEMTPKIAEVHLSCSELRQQFRSRMNMLRNGLAYPDEGHTLQGGIGLGFAQTGAPLLLTGGKNW